MTPSCKQPVGADDAVDLAAGQSVDHPLGLLVRQEAAERLDADRVAGEAIGERVAVLRHEQRRRGEHGDLLAVLDRLERGADGDLGLAETDVAAQQAIHRVRPLHVDLDIVDGDALIGCLDEREAIFHLGLPRRVVAEGVARSR